MTENEKVLLDAISSFSSIVGGVQIKFYTSKFVSIFKNHGVVDTEFCRLVKSSPMGYKMCDDCDKWAQDRSKLLRKAFTYHCHMGLNEMMHPSFINGNFVGSFFFGQFHQDADNIEYLFEESKKKLKKWELPVDDAWRMYSSIPVFDDEKINNIRTVLDLIAFYSVKNELITIENEPYINEIQTYIENHISENITLEDIAQHLYLSPAYISNLFSKKRKITLFKFIQSCRINHACFLLKSTDYPIKTICINAGFADQNYFARIFKQITGTTARDYRKQYSLYDSKDFFLKI